MDKDIKDKLIKAGKIAAQARDYGASIARPGIKLLYLAEEIERKIVQLGGKPAFPVNLSINDAAAHYTPHKNDETVLNKEDYLKIDVGAHINGYIGDTAVTIRLAGKDDLIICSEKMLEEALKLFVPGEKISHIGEAIENVAKKYGFNPVSNLTGHRLEQYSVHSAPGILNIKNDSKYILKEDDVFGVEPFCTTGNGKIKDSMPILIYAWMSDKPVRSPEARTILELSKSEFNAMPFAVRWIEKHISPLKTRMALKQLGEVGAIHPYPVLKEISGGNVAQSEHTVIVADKPIITTKL